MRNVEQKFWERVNKTDSCWLWMGSISEGGYGRFWKDNRHIKAHRMALELSGVAIPDGMVVDHICRVRNCVNPAHLRVATHRQNSVENSISSAAKYIQRDCCSKGHPFSGENIGIRADRGRRCRACAKEAKDRYNQKHRGDKHAI